MYRIHFQVGTRMYQSRSYLSILPDSSLTFAWQALLHVMVNSLAQIHRCKPWQQRQITYPTRSCTCIQVEPEKNTTRSLTLRTRDMYLLEKAFNLSSAGTEPNYKTEKSIEVSKELLFTVIHVHWFQSQFLYFFYIPFWFIGFASTN